MGQKIGGKVDAKIISVHHEGIFSFGIENDKQRPWWYYLYANHSPAYLIGNICGTCEAIFRRYGGASLPLAPKQLSSAFEQGITAVSQEMLDTISVLLPKGNFLVGIIEMTPTLENAGMDARMKGVFCETPQFWWRMVAEYAKPRGQDNELILPMVSLDLLHKERIDYYIWQMQQGLHPTALALSIIDRRTLRGENPVWQLAHFLLDGHHKVMAASQIEKPVSILSFLSIDEYADDVSHPFIRAHYHVSDNIKI